MAFNSAFKALTVQVLNVKNFDLMLVPVAPCVENFKSYKKKTVSQLFHKQSSKTQLLCV